MLRNPKPFLEDLPGNGLGSLVLSFLVEIGVEYLKRQEIIHIVRRKMHQQKGQPALPIEFPHELHLMGMDIRHWEISLRCFLRVKTDGNSLQNPHVIHRASLLEIGQGDGPPLAVKLYRLNGRRNLLNQGNPLLTIDLIRHVDHLFQRAASEAARPVIGHVSSCSCVPEPGCARPAAQTPRRKRCSLA